MQLKKTPGYKIIFEWLAAQGFQPFQFQEESWQHIIDGRSGLVNAPTGTGKTFSVFLGALIQFINDHPKNYQTKARNGLQLIWITPLRALAKDIGRAMERVIFELGLQWKVGIRNGDTSLSDRQKQKRQMPEVLIITPESLHLLLAQKGYPDVFKSLKIIAADEWHELMSSKRGVQVELAISRIVSLPPAPSGGGGVTNTPTKNLLANSSEVPNSPSTGGGRGGGRILHLGHQRNHRQPGTSHGRFIGAAAGMGI